jgi:hypothetical protein
MQNAKDANALCNDAVNDDIGRVVDHEFSGRGYAPRTASPRKSNQSVGLIFDVLVSSDRGISIIHPDVAEDLVTIF